MAAPVGRRNGRFVHLHHGSHGRDACLRKAGHRVCRPGSSVCNEPQDAQPRPVSDLLAAVRRADMGDPTAIAIRNEPQAATEFSIGRKKTVYVDPYSGAVLGPSSAHAHDYFFAIERLHRALGAPLGSKTAGRWVAAVANLLFAALITLGLILWLPRKWSRKAVRASVTFRAGLAGRAREWNWHNVVGIWCAIPLLVITLTGVVMSFDWANMLLFRLTGSVPAPQSRGGGERRSNNRKSQTLDEPDYDNLLAVARTLNSDWRSITLNVMSGDYTPVPAVVDMGTGGQPQKRAQYLLDRSTGAVLRRTVFSDGSLGQRLRAFVRFGHTGEYYGLLGQAIAALASLGASVLVYTGLSLSIRRLSVGLKRVKLSVRKTHAEPVA